MKHVKSSCIFILFILSILSLLVLFQNCGESSLVLPLPEEGVTADNTVVAPELQQQPQSFEIGIGASTLFSLALNSDQNLGDLEITWFLNDVLHSRGGELDLSNVAQGDFGLYHAVISNEVDEIVTDQFRVRQITDFDFGGMFSDDPAQPRNNPLTNARSCPAGYQAQKIAGTTRVGGAVGDRDIQFCYRTHDPQDQANAMDLGGMFGQVGPNIYPNPMTGSLSCPQGFIQERIRGASASDDGDAFYCHRPIVDGELKLNQFAGMYGGFADSPNNIPATSIPNPITGGRTCPPGYVATEFGGQTSVDFTIAYCSRN